MPKVDEVTVAITVGLAVLFIGCSLAVLSWGDELYYVWLSRHLLDWPSSLVNNFPPKPVVEGWVWPLLINLFGRYTNWLIALGLMLTFRKKAIYFLLLPLMVVMTMSLYDDLFLFALSLIIFYSLKNQKPLPAAFALLIWMLQKPSWLAILPAILYMVWKYKIKLKYFLVCMPGIVWFLTHIYTAGYIRDSELSVMGLLVNTAFLFPVFVMGAYFNKDRDNDLLIYAALWLPLTIYFSPWWRYMLLPLYALTSQVRIPSRKLAIVLLVWMLMFQIWYVTWFLELKKDYLTHEDNGYVCIFILGKAYMGDEWVADCVNVSAVPGARRLTVPLRY